MNYTLLKELLEVAELFERTNETLQFAPDIHGFKQWLYLEMTPASSTDVEPNWDGKEKGRTPESVISTMMVHMNRYARAYSKSVIHGSAFSTQEEFIYLISLQAYGPMTKMELIRKNIQDKPSGMLIINRLLQQGWIVQVESTIDKRSKLLQLTSKGKSALEKIKKKIDMATKLVAGNLTRMEQLELIRLLQKLEKFHQHIFLQNIDRAELLDKAVSKFPSN